MKKNYLKEYTVIHHSLPTDEQLSMMIADIQEYFDNKYGKVAQKKEKPVENFSLDNCTTKANLMQERDN